MSSHPQKQGSKMCKSPKNANFQSSTNKPEKIIINEYETLNTNCTGELKIWISRSFINWIEEFVLN